jgi:hypothetical protein
MLATCGLRRRSTPRRCHTSGTRGVSPICNEYSDTSARQTLSSYGRTTTPARARSECAPTRLRALRRHLHCSPIRPALLLGSLPTPQLAKPKTGPLLTSNRSQTRHHAPRRSRPIATPSHRTSARKRDSPRSSQARTDEHVVGTKPIPQVASDVDASRGWRTRCTMARSCRDGSRARPSSLHVSGGQILISGADGRWQRGKL